MFAGKRNAMTEVHYQFLDMISKIKGKTRQLTKQNPAWSNQ